MSIKDIPSGNFFFGRFDCPHAGVGYTSNNIRIHCYVDPIQVESSTRIWRNNDEVYFANVHWIDYDKLTEVKRKNALHAATIQKKQKSEKNAEGKRLCDARQEVKKKRECCKEREYC